jgi:hypothetical protein
MVSITLGNGNELFINDQDQMGIRKIVRGEPTAQIDLGPALLNSVDDLVSSLRRISIHCVDHPINTFVSPE